MDYRLLALVPLVPILLGSGSIKLYDTDSKTTFTMVEPMDCTVLKTTANGITLGFKIGTAFIGVGPEVTFGDREQVKWEEAVQALIVQYKELCAGLIPARSPRKGTKPVCANSTRPFNKPGKSWFTARTNGPTASSIASRTKSAPRPDSASGGKSRLRSRSTLL